MERRTLGALNNGPGYVNGVTPTNSHDQLTRAIATDPDSLDFLTTKPIHGIARFVVGVHNDETTTARCVVNGGENDCVGYRSKSRK